MFVKMSLSIEICLKQQRCRFTISHTTVNIFGKDQRMPPTGYHGYISYPAVSESDAHYIWQ